MRPGYKTSTRAAGLALRGLMSSVLESSKVVWVCEDHGLRVGWWWCLGKFSVQAREGKRRQTVENKETRREGTAR